MCETCQTQSGASSSRRRLVERPSEARAARIVLAVRADEEERVFDRRACKEVEPAEVLVGLELGPRNGVSPGLEAAVNATSSGRPRRSGRLTNRSRPCGTERTWSSRCCLTWSERPLPVSASRAQSPRYSIRNQLSIRLAVAASGSSFSRERSAQKGDEAPSIGVLRDQADDLARRDRLARLDGRARRRSRPGAT